MLVNTNYLTVISNLIDILVKRELLLKRLLVSSNSIFYIPKSYNVNNLNTIILDFKNALPYINLYNMNIKTN
jgi:hypothetical protein